MSRQKTILCSRRTCCRAIFVNFYTNLTVIWLYDDSLLSICNIKPYAVTFSSVYISLTNSIVSPTHILKVINGNVVGLCGIDVEQVQNNVDTAVNSLKVFIRPPLTKCYGHGIVRGIDINKRLIYINTPLTLKTLKYINCLVGCTPIPKELFELCEQDKPYSGGTNDLPISKNTCRGFFLSSKI